VQMQLVYCVKGCVFLQDSIPLMTTFHMQSILRASNKLWLRLCITDGANKDIK